MSHYSYESTGDEDFDEMLRMVTKTLKLKQAEYARPENKLANFDEVAKDVDTPPAKVWWTFFYKHVCSVRNFIRDGQTFTEPIEGRVMDLIVYLLLFYKMLMRDRHAKSFAELKDVLAAPHATGTDT